MPNQNLEIKARCHSLDVLRQHLITLNAQYRQTMRQVDTYFTLSNSASLLVGQAKGVRRLKLREINDNTACLVYYERPNTADSRYSHYQLYDISSPATFKQLMTAALGVKIVVEKERELWMFGHTRIHLDRVKDLGEFIELETVLKGQTEAEAHAEHETVKNALGIKTDDLIHVSYSDLILK